MKSFEYGDREIGAKEVFMGVANMVIGFGVLTLPKTLLLVTNSFDGWISIFFGGLIGIGAAFILAKLISRFPKKNFHEFTSVLINKPVANILTLFFAGYTLLLVSYEMRGVADISKLYLFDRTPIEVICFVFLLVLIYAVAGESVIVLRINLMFLPIILFIIFILLLLNLSFFEFNNLKPFFITGWKELAKGTEETVFAFLGFEILLFYNAFINKPKTTTKSATFGMAVPLVLYLLVFVFVLGVFGVEVTKRTLYPTAELAKLVEIPGGFFERFESIFFTIWVMTLYGTASMAFDVTILALSSVFKKVKRMTFIYIIAPISYLIAMTPQNIIEINLFGKYISYAGIFLAMILPLPLLVISYVRGVRENG